VFFALIFSALFGRYDILVEESEGVSLEIVDFCSCDVVGNPQYYFPVKTTAHSNVTIRNYAIYPRNVSIYLCAKDALDVIVGSDELNTTIPANTSAYYIMNIYIPKWAFVGQNATAQVSIFEEGIVVDNDTTDFFIDWEDKTPPTIHIPSPENVTYKQSSVPLTFVINERTSVPWISYCLDGLENTTITGNTTLTDLSNGLHSVIVFASDTSNNTGSSNKVHFSVSVVHDVAVVCAEVSPNEAHIGQIINITIVAQNEGTAAETFNITAYFNDTAIQTQTVTNLPPANQTTLTFHWNTTSVTPGNYTIAAQASQVQGEIDTTDNRYADGIVKIRGTPVAHFTYSPPNPKACEPVTFNASSSTLDGGYIVFYRWDFGDGNTTSLSDPITIHHYVTFGNYTVILTVIDDYNLTDSETTIVNVRMHPVASFVYSPLEPLAGAAISFNASASTPNGGSITQYDWNFGDGYVDSTPNPIITHVYMLPGTYNLTLTVTDTEELNNTTWKHISIYTHDIATTNITTSKTIIGQGYSLRIKVIVTNQGNYTEEINVTICSNITNPIATRIITLTSENFTTIIFTWETTGVTYGNYTISAHAAPVPSETDVSDNALTDGTVLVTIPGDVNGDRKVNFVDLYTCLIPHIGCDKGEPCYVPNYDINCDGRINMADIYIAVLHFGESW
jgi:PKD repeat protein